ncbi:hypothetical protein GC089_04765 [Cellulomonas sp. JZ18]|uniref:putative Ig domain-containing protein n=1 Tax=Cellulomonas sp. JZ18 TaxID=2654191 RepID=UPI0012D4B1AF|nr:putative Ig domain-containing protein [Cellulomonas sp. JZ18]QGQ18685.1 hypothetical protein GC089_04765 [Cellulomonas sp. JZ18]
MPISRPGRLTAALLTAVLALSGAAVALPATAAEPAGFTVDDFAGRSMGTRTPAAGDMWTCEPSQGSSVTVTPGRMRVEAGVDGCVTANTWVDWDAPAPVDLTAGGTLDRILLKYEDVHPQVEGNPIAFSVTVWDADGRQSAGSGLSRPAQPDFLTVRYRPAYEGDAAWLRPVGAGADLTRVTRLRLGVAGTLHRTPVSVTFTSLGFESGEPAYEAPTVPADPLVFRPAAGPQTQALTVTGFPEPDVSVSGGPAWLTSAAVKGDRSTRVTFTGDPGTAYADTTVRVRATVANSLVAERDVRVVVPSPVTFAPAAGPVTVPVGVAADTTLGTVSSVPVAAVAGATGTPAGTRVVLTDGRVALTGTPTAPGEHTVRVTLDTGFESRTVEVPVLVTAPPAVAEVPAQAWPRGEPVALDVQVTGVPAPTVAVAGLPAGVTAAPTSDGVRIAGTPTVDGASTVRVTATSTAGTAERTLDVVVGSAPVLTLPTDVTGEAGAPLDVPLGVSASPDAVVTATGLPEGWSVTGTGATRTLSGTAPRTAAGTGLATVTARNAFGETTGELPWTLTAAPALTGAADLTWHVGTYAQHVLEADGFPAPRVTVAGADGGPLALPAGLRVEVRGQQVVLSGTPTAAGSAVVRVTAAGTRTVTHDVTVRALLSPVFPDAAPVLVAPTGTRTAWVLDVEGHEAPALTVDPALPGWLTFDAATRTFTATPAATDAGEHGPFTVTARNAAGEATATLTVRATRPAAVTGPGSSVPVVRDAPADGTVLGRVAGFPLPAVTADNLPTGLSVVLDADGTVRLTGTPVAGEGPRTVTLRADNGLGAPATAAVTLVLRAHARVDAPASVQVAAGEQAHVPLTLGGYPAPVVTATGLPAGLRVAEDGTALVGTPGTPGVAEVELRADNGVGAVATARLRVEVATAPQLVGTPARLVLHAGLGETIALGTVAGSPSPAVTADGLPAGLTLVQDGADLRLVGATGATGEAEVTLTAANGPAHPAATRTLQLTVVAPAAVSAPTEVVARLGEPLTPVPVTVSGYPRPSCSSRGSPRASGSRSTARPSRSSAHPRWRAGTPSWSPP